MSATDNQSQAAKQLLPSAPVSLRLSVWASIFLLLSASCVSETSRIECKHRINWYRVESVLSSDTIIVKGIVGKVKYIGVAAPQRSLSRKPDEKFWRESLEKNRELVEGRWVRLEFDRKREDASGKVLAYVFVEENYYTETFVNGEILRLGLARVEQSTVNTRYLGRLERLQQRAKQNRRGIWSSSALLQRRE